VGLGGRPEGLGGEEESRASASSAWIAGGAHAPKTHEAEGHLNRSLRNPVFSIGFVGLSDKVSLGPNYGQNTNFGQERASLVALLSPEFLGDGERRIDAGGAAAAAWGDH